MVMEREIKLSITIGDLPTLLAALPEPTAVKELCNEYFDTPGRLLGKRREMLRLRTRRGKESSVLCFKGPSQRVGALFQASENEWTLSHLESQEFKSSPLSQVSILEEFIDADVLTNLQSIGAMEVRRVCVPFSGGLLLEIDHVRYPDGFEDAEIELEVSPQQIDIAHKILNKVVADAGITTFEQSETKYARFLKHGGGA